MKADGIESWGDSKETAPARAGANKTPALRRPRII